MPSISVGQKKLSLEQLVSLSKHGTKLSLATVTKQKIQKSRKVVEQAMASGQTVYGVNTGFGKLSGVTIEADRLGALQRNLILSHATGVGDLLPPQVCRLAFALRIHNLARGFSGVRLKMLQNMLRLINADMIPAIPSQGSVGASGDLAPLAHMALPLLGYGHVYNGSAGNKLMQGAAALRKLGLKPLDLAAKEGLALINGTQIMTAIGLLTLDRAINLNLVSDMACAMTVEALRASEKPFAADVHELRAHPGQMQTAANLRALLRSSKIMPSHANCDKVQDAYSLRCAPQVHGAAKDAVNYVSQVLLTEASSVTDNPLVFPDGEVISAGNFHGQPVSQAMDFLAISMCTLANISERRVENLVNPDISGLPPFLAHEPGIESGFMIPQVVAAALASENKTLAHPASVDTIPTSANREDHVSMGVTAARHAHQVLLNTEKVLGIELLCAAQGLDCGEPLRPGRGVEAAYNCIRQKVPALKKDRFLAPDLRQAEILVADGELLAQVRKAVRSLKL